MRYLAAAAVLAVLAGCSSTSTHPSSSPPAPATTTATGSSAPTARPVSALTWPAPRQALTPGDVVPGCTYPRPPRSPNEVTAAVKAAVKAAYHYTGRSGLRYVEYDHRVPYALCGGHDTGNIWPEPYDGAPTSTYIHNHKDELEDVVISRVRHHRLTLAAGQRVFEGDWRVAWCEYVHHPGVSC